MLKLFNTLTRKKEIFKPIEPKKVKMYSCGPTVYNLAHIGNFRAYLFSDILRRYLEYKGYGVIQVMNITDIDDKTIRDSGRAQMSLKEFTQKYTKEFFKDLKTLNIKKAHFYPRATHHIKEMIKFVEVLEKKGFAYERHHSVYFDISKFKDYGKLSRIDLKKIIPGKRVDLDEYQKDAPGDFVLLKRSTLEELKRGIFYETKWGKVRPGWHLECSVMSMKYLGETFDIHTGGVDLIFPHHENEIAQSEAYSGKKFVNFWLHNEHLLVNGKKMSKSLGNFYTLRDLLKMEYSWRAIRYFLISAHYRQKLNLTFSALKSAENTIERIREFLSRLNRLEGGKNKKKIEELIKKTKENFERAMDDDLNTPKALAVFFKFIGEINKIEKITKTEKEKIKRLIRKLDSVFGLKILELEKEKIKVPKEIRELVRLREKFRKEKKWEKADEIREKIKQKGYWIEDTREGPKIRKILFSE